MITLWGWAIALLCIAALSLFLFACLFVALLTVRAPQVVPVPAVGADAADEAIRDRYRRAGSAGRPPLPGRGGSSSAASVSRGRAQARRVMWENAGVKKG